MVFTVDINACEDEVTLVLHGELDLLTQPCLANVLADLRDDDSRIVLDLADLHFIDAGCAGLIDRAQRLARSRGNEFILRSPTQAVERLLRLIGLETATADKVPIEVPSTTHSFAAGG